jgi:hypothetical protein
MAERKRTDRFVLGERIERNLYDLLETLIQAKYTKQRQPLLEQPNLMLEILRFQMRLAKDLQCLKVESYSCAAKAIDEIGELVGGWLKTSGTRASNTIKHHGHRQHQYSTTLDSVGNARRNASTAVFHPSSMSWAT